MHTDFWPAVRIKRVKEREGEEKKSGVSERHIFAGGGQETIPPVL
jgi:hypothetical protein